MRIPVYARKTTHTHTHARISSTEFMKRSCSNTHSLSHTHTRASTRVLCLCGLARYDVMNPCGRLMYIIMMFALARACVRSASSPSSCVCVCGVRQHCNACCQQLFTRISQGFIIRTCARARARYVERILHIYTRTHTHTPTNPTAMSSLAGEGMRVCERRHNAMEMR